MKEEVMISALVEEYEGLYKRHTKLLKMIQKIIPLLAEMEDTEEMRKVITILTRTGAELIMELHKKDVDREYEEESED